MTDPLTILGRSRALWNFARLDLGNDEVLAQILDRGSLEDWRALYALLRQDDPPARALRQRIKALLQRVPTCHAWFWLAAIESLGERVDPAIEPKLDEGYADI